MMASDVDVPAIGNVKKEWVYAGVALLIGIVGFAYWRSRGTTTQTVGSDPTAFQGAQLPVGSYDAYGKLAANTTDGSPPANWGLNAIDYLSNAFGYDKQTAGIAISKYLNGEALTQSQADLVNLARAVLGNSPTNTAAVGTLPTPTTPPPVITTPPPSTEPDYTNPDIYWDPWQAMQRATGQYHGDPAGGLDWGELARNTFGATAKPKRVEVMVRASQMQSLNRDAATRYMTYVPQNVIPTLRVA